MDGDKRLKINVKIAGREFALFVMSDMESEVRNAAKLITEAFEKYHNKFPNEDYANILAKSSLHVLLNQGKKVTAMDDSKLMEGLYHLEDDLDSFIKETL